MADFKSKVESLREWVVEHKLRTVGCLWLSGITGSIAYNWSQPNMKTSVKIIHARFWKINRWSVVDFKGKKKGVIFTVDCTKHVEDIIMDAASFEKFLQERIKVGGKRSAPNGTITVAHETSKIIVTSYTNFLKK